MKEHDIFEVYYNRSPLYRCRKRGLQGLMPLNHCNQTTAKSASITISSIYVASYLHMLVAINVLYFNGITKEILGY